MTLLVDYAWAKPTPAAIKAAGYSGAMRYLSPDPSKNLTASERDGLLNAGLGIGLVWESIASRAGQGSKAGAQDAVAAEAQAKALGLPANVPIFYAVDFDASPGIVAPYFAGVTSVATRPVGVYGSLRVVEGTNVPWKWQAAAWSAGKVSSQAHLYQRLTATVPHPIPSTDENIVIRPFPMWTKTPPTPRKPSKPGSWPTYPLAASQWYGVNDGTLNSHSGARVSDQPYVKLIQGRVRATQDGSFGPTTQALVRGYQGSHGLATDGKVGPITWTTMRALA